MKGTNSYDNYCVTALWSSTDDQGNPLDDNYTIDDIVFNPKVAEELESFYRKAEGLLHGASEINTWEHDFWLTRNGHGAGFWDGDYLEGDKLTALAESYGGSDLYVGDDGKLYFS